jgi:LacI family transcriptional regulator
MSIVEVAKQAGVSPATVSRCLNGQAKVAPETAHRVREAMTKLNYAPSARRPGPKPHARRGIRTGNVTFLSIGTLEPEAMFRMPAFPAMLGQIQSSLAERGLHLVLAHYDGHGPTPRTILRSNTDGVLLFDTLDPMPAKLREALLNVPSVWVMRRHSDSHNEFDHVFYDNRSVGPLAARYLLEQGHRRLAFINGQFGHDAFFARRDGFVETARTGGAQVMTWETSRAELNGMAARAIEDKVRELMASPDRPTGIFVPSDDDLLTVFHSLRLCGVEPQRDVLLIGCNNDLTFMAQMHPRPATIDIKLDLVGERAVEQLLRRMRDPKEPLARIYIQPAVVPGENLE